MDYAQRISRRLWNQPDMGERESLRERTFIDDIVQKSHIEKALLGSLEGVHTALDAGGGSGRFSILLAKRGVKVTHFDISGAMIDKAKALAKEAGALDHMEFVLGALEDLPAFGYPPRSFDLVMSFDAPVSYTWPRQNDVIAHLAALARRKIMLSVTSRLGSLPYYANPAQKDQFILEDDSDDPWVQWTVSQRGRAYDGFVFDKAACDLALASGMLGDMEAAAAQYDAGETPWVPTYGFAPDELKGALEANGVRHVRLAGPGAFARTLPQEALRHLMNDPAQRADFLDFCYVFDQNPYVCGLGKDNLLAIGDIDE